MIHSKMKEHKCSPSISNKKELFKLKYSCTCICSVEAWLFLQNGTAILEKFTYMTNTNLLL